MAPWILLALFILIALLILSFIVRYVSTNKLFTDIDSKNVDELPAKYRFYLLGLAIYVPFTEFILHYFKIRQQSELLSNVIFGVCALTLYIISIKFKRIKEHFYYIFIVFFNVYALYTLGIVFASPTDNLVVSEFTLIIMFSFLVYTKKIQFITFNISILILLFIFHLFFEFDLKSLIIYTNIINIAFALNFAIYFINKRIYKSIHTSYAIANSGPMFTIGIDSNGSIDFVSQNTWTVLKLNKNRILKGAKIDEILHTTTETIMHSLQCNPYIQYKIPNTTGDECIIQLQKLNIESSLTFISGIDITNDIKLKRNLEIQRNRFESLLAKTGDLVFVLDKNLVATELFNKGNNDLLHLPEYYFGKHLTEIGFNIKKIKDIQSKIEETISTNEPTYIEYSLKPKNTVEWYVMKIYALKSSDNETQEIVLVCTNITATKIKEKEKILQEEQLRKQQDFLLKLSLTTIDSFETELTYYAFILSQTCKLLGISRSGIWIFNHDRIECKVLFCEGITSFPKNLFLELKDYPLYFEHISKHFNIIAYDAQNHPKTSGFLESYLKPNAIKSLIDLPIRHDGRLYAILCCEQTQTVKQWNDHDINFAKQIANILSTSLAVNKRKETENKLEHTQKILLQSSQVAKLGAFEYHLIDQTIIWSETACNLLEIPSNKKFSILEVEELIPQNDRKVEFKTSIQNAIQKGKSFDLEVQIVTLKGVKKWFRILGKPEMKDNECTCLCGAVQDIDEQVKAKLALSESERHFKQINETIKDVFWLYDLKEEKIIYISPSCKHMFGHTEEEFYTNNILWQTYTHPDDILKVKEAHNRLFKEEYFELEYRILVNNEEKWVYEKSFCIKDENGHIIKNTGINIDITQKKLLSRQIEHNKELEIENKSKTIFLANMSHEIRTPLNGIIGISDLLLGTALNLQQREYLSKVNESALLLKEIIDNILDFSKLNSSAVVLNIENVDLRILCKKVSQIISFQANQKELPFEVTIKADVPDIISTDDIRLKQVLLNLLSNAVKFTNIGKVVLILEKIKTEEKEFVRFSIQDTGIGIKKENIEKIFESFTQEDSTTTKKYGGTGLGLSICASLVKMLGSKIFVESEVGKGSNFYFDLPIQQSIENIPQTHSNIKYSKTFKLEAQKGNLTLLLAEDNKVNMFLLKAILHEILINPNFIEVENGKDAFEYMKNHTVDLIFTDIQMPVMNGLEACKAIRSLSHTSKIPIIAITAGNIDDITNQAFESGMNDVLEKPIFTFTIANCITKWIPTISTKVSPSKDIEISNINFEKLQIDNDQNPTYLKTIFPYIKESLQEGIKDLNHFYEQKDYKSVAIVAHRIKGTALTASFSTLAQLTYRLEKHDFIDSQDATDNIHSIQVEIESLLTLL